MLFLSYSCGGGGAGSGFSSPGSNPGVVSVVQLTPSQNVAQTNSSITLRTKVLDGNGVPVPNVAVTFTDLSAPFGVLQSFLKVLGLGKHAVVLSATVVNTDAYGIASVNLFSSTEGFATILAQVNTGVGNVRDRKTVLFIAADSFNLAPTLTLDVDDGDGVYDQPADFLLFKTAGDDQRIIRATVTDRFGMLAFDASVTFGADMPYKTSSTATTCSDGSTSCNVIFPNGNIATTDANGQAFVLVEVLPGILSDIQTVLNITATATLTDNSTAFNLISLFLSPVSVSPSLSSVTANPTIVSVGKTSTVTATVMTDVGTPVPDGTSVNFTTAPKTASDPTPCGSITPFAQTTGGVATATFTAPLVPGVCTVSAQVSGVLIGTVDITATTTLSVQPPTQTINGVTGGTATFTIFGGVAPYTITSDNVLFPPSSGSVATNGGSFTVAVPAGSEPVTVTYTVRDSAGATATGTLIITGLSPTLTLTPTTFNIDTSGGAGTVTVNYFVSGGQAPYKVYFTLTDIVSSPANGTTEGVAGTNQADFPVVYTWPGVVNEKFQVIVVDTLGAFATSDVNVTGTAPTPTPDFTINCAPTAVNGTTTSTCTLTSVNGYSNTVALSCNPTDATGTGSVCSMAPASVVPPGSSILTLNCAAATPATNVPFQVVATDGTITHAVNMTATCP